MMETRDVQPEILDDLPADDPRAIQSRSDLRKVNAFMGHTAIVVRELRAAATPLRLLVELGSGDGTFLLRVARRLRVRSGVRAVFVDRRPSVSEDTRSEFKASGWDIDICQLDVFEWLRRPGPETSDVIVANLFLHHFRDKELAELLALASRQTASFISCEPRRSRTALSGVSLLRLLGCNDVTLHDGKKSVRAGFRGAELSALWPSDPGWRLNEGPVGLFSHMFVASKVSALCSPSC